VLMDHAAVAQVVTFAMPDAKLGEEVAAAVVLHENTLATERELQEFAATRLADFKVPRQVIILDEIPKGPTGKLQRIGLAEKLGLRMHDQGQTEGRAEFVAPRTPVEEELAKIWTQVLGIEQVGIHDNFFLLGGDSVLATQFISRVREALQVELSLISLFETPTIADLAVAIAQNQAEKHEEIARMLAELEDLSEEEAQRLLADEMRQRGSGEQILLPQTAYEL